MSVEFVETSVRVAIENGWEALKSFFDCWEEHTITLSGLERLSLLLKDHFSAALLDGSKRFRREPKAYVMAQRAGVEIRL